MLVASNSTTHNDHSHHDNSVSGVTVNVASAGSDANSIGLTSAAAVRNALLMAQVNTGIA